MLSDTGPVAAILLTDALLEQAWAAAASESFFAAPIVFIVAFAVALSRHLGRDDSEAAESTARLLRSSRPECGVDAVLRNSLRELRRLAGARDAIVALDDPSSPALLLIDRSVPEAAAEMRELGREEYPVYFFPLDSTGDVKVIAVDAPCGFVPPAFQRAHPCNSLMAVTFRCGETRDGRVLLLDPDPRPDRDAFLRTLERRLSQLLPALGRLSELHARRHRAASRERARIGRELHDGLVQRLASIEIELELIRSGADPRATQTVERLERVQRRLRAEISEVRTLILRERSRDIHPPHLPDVIADLVERFARESAVEATYVTHVTEVRLSPKACSEIALIVQEALVNVRRHSGARRVRVTFSCDRAEWSLSVQDDGRGFGAGRLEAGCGAARSVRPPSVIRERAHSLGGTVRVVAPGGRGARLEITARSAQSWNPT